MQRGYTLIEAIIVLAIAGLLIAGVWLYSSSSINAAKKNKLAEQTIQIMTNVRNTLQNAPNANGLTLPSAIDAGIIPSDMVRGTAPAYTVAHAFNGVVTLNPNADDSLVDLFLAGVPGDSCIDLISGRLAATADAADQFGISRIVINGQEITDFAATNAASDIADRCGNGIVNITITFSAS